MAKSLLVLSNQEGFFSFLIEGLEIQKIKVERRGLLRIVDSIFKGKVKKVVKGMDGAFVDIGLEKEAYLPFRSQCKGEHTEPLKVGEEVLVQVFREPVGEKGAKLTRRIKLVGKYVICLPTTSEVKCSSKMEKEEKERLRNANIKGTHTLKTYGITERTLSFSIDNLL
ncbi:MAG: S1 RNA-binding domain-containing protein, partial [Hydrogenobacter sp.]